MLSHPSIQVCLPHHAEHAQTHPHPHPPSASAVRNLAQITSAAASLLVMSTETVMVTEAGMGLEVTQQIGMTQKKTSVMMQLLCMVTGRAITARQRASANQTETAVEILAELLTVTDTMVTGTELGSQTGDGMMTGLVTGHCTMETGGRRGAADPETLLGAMPAQLSGTMYIMSSSSTGMHTADAEQPTAFRGP